MPYIAKGKYYTYGLKTLSEIDSIANPSRGETVYCTDYNRIFTYENQWMCSDFVYLVNRSGGALSRWDLVVAETGGTSTEIACTTTTTIRAGEVMGPVVFGGSNGAGVCVAVKGNWRVKVDEAIAYADGLESSTTAGQAQKRSGTYYGGIFGWATSTTAGAGEVDCVITSRKEYF